MGKQAFPQQPLKWGRKLCQAVNKNTQIIDNQIVLSKK